ncbi:phage antirepressor KilAC domain-containing protein [Hymenobacter aerilatus]|uniref:Phage antirepressor KilAC domain-containing protein n=1 Tax=Hymenobacter aerilatus TaxID=2932251 RepID=A0A8T9T179_9BACT|nr:phage antirepressor KilAC domain-containing protein [Hymenobacter aerilatus]UOR05846.1 phage antirepressor KilAC domain-containing protein [Hymenobacter aerilatus]
MKNQHSFLKTQNKKTNNYMQVSQNDEKDYKREVGDFTGLAVLQGGKLLVTDYIPKEAWEYFVPNVLLTDNDFPLSLAYIFELGCQTHKKESYEAENKLALYADAVGSHKPGTTRQEKIDWTNNMLEAEGSYTIGIAARILRHGIRGLFKFLVERKMLTKSGGRYHIAEAYKNSGYFASVDRTIEITSPGMYFLWQQLTKDNLIPQY